MKKIIIIIIIIIVGGLGYWIYQSTLTPKGEDTGWKVYRNEERGFEIGYPNNWYVRDLIIESFGKDKLRGGILSTFPNAHPFMEPDIWQNLKGENMYLTIALLDESLTQGFSEHILSLKQHYSATAVEESMLGDIKIIKRIMPGLNWYLVDPKTQEIYSIEPTIFKDGSFLFNTPENIEYTNNENLFEEIISTFRFLD